MPYFESFSEKTIGGSHKEHDLPCEDSADHRDKDGVSIAVVSDGHGADRYFRSAQGSQFAVDVTLQQLDGPDGFVPKIAAFLSNEESEESDLKNGKLGQKLLQQFREFSSALLQQWRKLVSDDIEARPFADDPEFNKLSDAIKASYKNAPAATLRQAYGATLVFVVHAENFWFGVHIGDGHHIVLDEDGAWRQPIPWDKQCVLEVTTSLCDAEAENEFRYWLGWESGDHRIKEFTYGPDDKVVASLRDRTAKPVAMFVGSDGVDDNYNADNLTKELSRRCYCPMMINIKDNGLAGARILDDFVQIYALNQGYKRDDVSIAGMVSTPISDDIYKIVTKQYEDSKESDKLAVRIEEWRRKHRAEIAERQRAKKIEVKLQDMRRQKDSLDADAKKHQRIVDGLKSKIADLKTRLNVAESQKEQQQQETNELDVAISQLENQQQQKEATISRIKKERSDLENELWTDQIGQGQSRMLVYVVDVSDAMKERNKAAAVLAAIQKALESLKTRLQKQGRASVFVDIIEYSDEARWQSPAPIAVGEFKPRPFECKGPSHIQSLSQLVQDKFNALKSNSVQVQWEFILISASTPSDDWRSALEELAGNDEFARSERSGISIGNRVDRAFLEKITGDKAHVRKVTKPKELADAIERATVQLASCEVEDKPSELSEPSQTYEPQSQENAGTDTHETVAEPVKSELPANDKENADSVSKETIQTEAEQPEALPQQITKASVPTNEELPPIQTPADTDSAQPSISAEQQTSVPTNEK
ncbi:MAG: protein phosphatase 2C domain-containing protein [Bifidobacterium tibiigranuli]|jgi:uncharacterized protein YegL|uniref:protein phosphatase 2C domain-containing protein n=1 Tax=Bifidobacterium tibiigranuli TaxID=2172043 RepID=UPI0026F26C39|nr:protein phosphatase 2C domain-containing protein [Bifidobacterium tibiigranuli]MCI1673758.1 protein phosphatase 2C domain-containing protein [Bifidobacterium tibiigranuli]MCI1712007.1 protein phosphatase 2C domain-containing protein [Bifidobacterium tibiigranuli]